jgi:heparan-alpha-glucosaminide N-acetyltransferase
MSTEMEHHPARVLSIDAARGLVMFSMIFVNDIAGVSHEVVPDWMRHYHGSSGMTFVDMVFPAFLFIMGMSIPFALGGRLKSGEPVWKTLRHVVARTLSLLLVGILMVNNENPGRDMSGISPNSWSVLMYLCAMLAFCSISTPARMEPSGETKKGWQLLSRALRCAGLAGLVVLAFMFRGDQGQRIITLSPFVIHTSWYGILGLIAWAYLVGSMVYLAFRTSAVALLASMVLLLALYPADKTGAFDGFWLNRYLGIGDMLGALPSIGVGGLLLASILPPSGQPRLAARLRFTVWFGCGCAAGACLLKGLYGINKNEATPSWCLWACVFTAIVWLVFHILSDLGPIHPVAKMFTLAGRNVLLAYLLSEMMPSLFAAIGVDQWYDKVGNVSFAAALVRSAAMGAALLAATVGLNRLGFRLKL